MIEIQIDAPFKSIVGKHTVLYFYCRNFKQDTDVTVLLSSLNYPTEA